MGEAKPLGDGRVSHGICSACYDFHMPALLEMDLSQHLDEYPEPTIMVDADVRVIGINQAMAAFLGRDRRDGLGLLGGELMDCRHASLPDGCGKTVHCPDCSIRETVNLSRATGADMLNVKAAMDRDDATILMRVSAYPRDEFVKVVVLELLGSEPRPA
jgi:PAS domain-containing protein